jgi:thiol-disulfide isomerase/thioredoxin
MKHHHIPLITIAALVLLVLTEKASAAERLIKAGEPFPRLSFEQPLSEGEANYLGLSNVLVPGLATRIVVADIDAELIVVEFLNRYCPSCQAQAPIMNEVYEAISSRPELKKKIKFIGIAAGNNLDETVQYKKEKQVPFPVFTDAEFIAYDAIGDPGGTPCIILVKKEDSRLTVAQAHVGLISSKEKLLQNITSAVSTEGKTNQAAIPAEAIPRAEARMLTLNLKEAELRALITKSMLTGTGATGYAKLASLSSIILPESGAVYRGEITGGTQRTILFSKVISRKPTCDVCHGIHFIITFDRDGVITDFYPIHLTKYGNAQWDKKDINVMRSRIVGRSLLQQKTFNPGVDAVSAATMSSALIFNSLNRMQETFTELKQVNKNL